MESGGKRSRIAQQAITNAMRHARHMTRIIVHVTDEGDQVRLTVHDGGETSAAARTPAGYGMAERVNRVGGTFRAGPDPDRGWTVDAVLPKGVTTL